MTSLSETFDHYQEKILPFLYNAYSHAEILSLIDLTLLEHDATEDSLKKMKDFAQQHQTAAICVYPEHLPIFKSLNGIKKATVVNFPEGNNRASITIDEIKSCIEHYDVDEIDYVFPYHVYQAGEKQEALAHVQQCYKLCQSKDKIFKVILETGAFKTLDEIHLLSKEIIATGCDFLKTSTGKIAEGASIEAAYAMLLAVKASNKQVGIKVSGGIKTKEQAIQYISMTHNVLGRPVHASWFRIGASSLAEALI